VKDPEPELERLSQHISQIREDQPDLPLEMSDLDPDPFIQFAAWLSDALEVHKGWPNAMTLSTADAKGRPSARIVLLKGIDERGFSFFTNLESRKGRELAENPYAALTFYWPLQGRQVCVRGSVQRVGDAEAEEYFATRPRSSQLGAWASKQSAPLSSRQEIEEAVADLEARFPNEVPKPPHWGGFLLDPNAFEFWKSRVGRLHDRFLYGRSGDRWKTTRLNP
jgi:pyridoxamine 5'-phosphate oxidase